MKKVISLFIATALMCCVALPVFAATPGEDAGNLADTILQNPGNVAAAKDLTAKVKGDKDIRVTDKIVNAMKNAISAGAHDNLPAATDSLSTGSSVVVQAPAGTSSAIKVSALNVIPGTDGINSFAIDLGFANGEQSDIGAVVSVKVPGKWNTTVAYRAIADNSQILDGVTVTVSGNDTIISFWAPHFSTYAILPVVDSTTTPAPAPANTKNVVKKTGADMNTTTVLLMTAALVLGGLTVCGTVVAVKKLGVNK